MMVLYTTIIAVEAALHLRDTKDAQWKDVKGIDSMQKLATPLRLTLYDRRLASCKVNRTQWGAASGDSALIQVPRNSGDWKDWKVRQSREQDKEARYDPNFKYFQHSAWPNPKLRG